MEGEGQHVGGQVLAPVDPVDALDPAVVHADDAHVEPLHTEYVPQDLHVFAHARAPQRNHRLQVPQDEPHTQTTVNAINR